MDHFRKVGQYHNNIPKDLKIQVGKSEVSFLVSGQDFKLKRVKVTAPASCGELWLNHKCELITKSEKVLDKLNSTVVLLKRLPSALYNDKILKTSRKRKSYCMEKDKTIFNEIMDKKRRKSKSKPCLNFKDKDNVFIQAVVENGPHSKDNVLCSKFPVSSRRQTRTSQRLLLRSEERCSTGLDISKAHFKDSIPKPNLEMSVLGTTALPNNKILSRKYTIVEISKYSSFFKTERPRRLSTRLKNRNMRFSSGDVSDEVKSNMKILPAVKVLSVMDNTDKSIPIISEIKIKKMSKRSFTPINNMRRSKRIFKRSLTETSIPTLYTEVCFPKLMVDDVKRSLVCLLVPDENYIDDHNQCNENSPRCSPRRSQMNSKVQLDNISIDATKEPSISLKERNSENSITLPEEVSMTPLSENINFPSTENSVLCNSGLEVDDIQIIELEGELKKDTVGPTFNLNFGKASMGTIIPDVETGSRFTSLDSKTNLNVVQFDSMSSEVEVTLPIMNTSNNLVESSLPGPSGTKSWISASTSVYNCAVGNRKSVSGNSAIDSKLLKKPKSTFALQKVDLQLAMKKKFLKKKEKELALPVGYITPLKSFPSTNDVRLWHNDFVERTAGMKIGPLEWYQEATAISGKSPWLMKVLNISESDIAETNSKFVNDPSSEKSQRRWYELDPNLKSILKSSEKLKKKSKVQWGKRFVQLFNKNKPPTSVKTKRISECLGPKDLSIEPLASEKGVSSSQDEDSIMEEVIMEYISDSDSESGSKPSKNGKEEESSNSQKE